MQQGRTAILYFALRPETEALRKPIFEHHGHKINVQFYYDLQDHVFDNVAPLGFPLIHIDDTLQRGESFADKISNAVQDVWDKGFERVLILGNDCPEINVNAYQRAIETLDQGKSCLMQTQHGGAGLIALHKHQYTDEHWRELEWQSENTFDELFDCLANCRVLGDKLNEIGSLADAHTYIELNRDSDDVIAFLIDSILNPLRNFLKMEPSSQEQGFRLSQKLRGPPFKA